MGIAEIMRTVGETVSASANVKSVYGEPVTFGQRMVIPVATIRCTFGGGGGAERMGDKPVRGGDGGGGWATARPCGVVEVTAEGVRFIPFRDPGKIAAAVAIGFVLGVVLGYRRCRKAARKSL